MSLSKQYKTNNALETEGVAVPIGEPNEDGSIPTLVIGRTSKSNKPYQAALSKAAAPFQRQLQMKVDVSQQLEKAFMEVFCDTILRGWSNILLSDVTGNETDTGYAEFSKQNALSLFNRLPDIYEFAQEQASNVSLFLEHSREENAKN